MTLLLVAFDWIRHFQNNMVGCLGERGSLWVQVGFGEMRSNVRKRRETREDSDPQQPT